MTVTNKIEFNVTGMSCGHCEMAVKKALLSLDGVSSAEADHKAGRVAAEVDESTVSREAIVEAIKNAGYGVN
jgi:copper ion binding protein